MAIQQQKTNVEVSRTLRNKSYSCAHTTKVFNAAAVSNLVALVAIIVSYPILLLTNNNMMMISVRRICLKKKAN